MRVPVLGILFVSLVHVHVLACGGGGAPTSSTTPNASSSRPSSAPSSSSSVAASATPTSSMLHKRARTASPKAASPDGTKPKNGRPLNAKDNLGRTVFVRADDLCFVEVAPREKPPPDADVVTRTSELVDCPPATDDAAWDHCTAQIVLDENGKCYCVTGAGNPRPMPYPTTCPASAGK